MECHESLMARRRKRKAGGSSGKRPAGPNVKLDKSLPSLPPHLLEEAQVADESPSEYTGTPDPNRVAGTPDLDERPESSRSNQVDTGTRSLFPLNKDQCIALCIVPDWFVGRVGDNRTLLPYCPIDGAHKMIYSASSYKSIQCLPMFQITSFSPPAHIAVVVNP